MFYLISHVVFEKKLPIYGPVHVLAEFLKKKKQKVALVFLPLGLRGHYFQQTNGQEKKEKVSHPHVILKFIYDVWFVFKYLLKTKPQTQDAIIAVDPLNCFPATIFKFVWGYKLIYYTADYSDQRFPQPILNLIYTALDRICLSLCDSNWCVSERIVALRKKQGYSKKAVFMPNTPILSDKPRTQDISKKTKIVYVGRMDTNMSLEKVLEATAILKKTYPLLKLTLIGGGSLEKKILSTLRLNRMKSYVKYLGPLSNSKVISNLKKSGIGLALYSGGNDWNRYGDSMKIREYQHFGLPVVTTTIPSNSSQIDKYQSGIVLDEAQLETKKIVTAIKLIIRSYKKYSVRALRLAQDNDKEVLLNQVLKL